MLTQGRRSELLAAVTSSNGSNVALGELCSVCVEVTDVSGAGIALRTGEHRAALHTTNATSRLVDELQLTFGEGPCIDAHDRGRLVAEPDLANASATRWPLFSRAAVAGGVRAVFGFPINVGPVRLGALGLDRNRPGPLSTEQRDDATLIADAMARTIVGTQASATPGSIGAELESGTALRFVVHQASGMVAAQLDVGVSEALSRLRAYAFARNRLVTDVAEDVVARRLRLSEDED